MIVVDTNVLIYRIVDGDKTPESLRLEEKDPDWKIPALWEYEFGNALILMNRQKHVTPKHAALLFETAKNAFSPSVIQSDTNFALQLSIERNITFYDAQFLALAYMLNAPLVTEDKALRKASNGKAVSLEEFLG